MDCEYKKHVQTLQAILVICTLGLVIPPPAFRQQCLSATVRRRARGMPNVLQRSTFRFSNFRPVFSTCPYKDLLSASSSTVDLRFYLATNPAFKVAVRRGGSNGDEKESQAKAQENTPHQ